jgi:hypothetical protein
MLIEYLEERQSFIEISVKVNFTMRAIMCENCIQPGPFIEENLYKSRCVRCQMGCLASWKKEAGSVSRSWPILLLPQSYHNVILSLGLIVHFLESYERHELSVPHFNI